MRGRVLARAASSLAASAWKFGCTQCGRCCALGDRVVLVSAQEVAALEHHTALPPSAFVQLSSDGEPSLQSRGGACVFVADKKCSVYDARPTQCRTYPFWGETTTPLGWLRESARCEGIGQGADVARSAVALDVVQTDLALAGETTSFEEDRALLEDIPDVVDEQFEEQLAAGGVVRWDTPELCVVDSADPQTGRQLRTLVLKDEPAFSQSVVLLAGEAVVLTELAMPVHQALALALSFGRAPPTRILVVGGGGCSLPLALATILPHALVTAVELSPGVADAARRFFVPDPRRFDLVVGDGAQFLHAGSELFDLIIVDAAGSGQSPAPSLASDVFLATLHARLSSDGMLAVNSFGDASPTFARRVAERFGQNASALLELTAEDPSSVHTIVFAQKNWDEGVAAETWRARLKGGGAAHQLCGTDLARHAADHLRAVS